MKKAGAILGASIMLSAASLARGAAIRYGTEADARALLRKAVALFEKEGNSAIVTIGKPSGPFLQHDLYVFVIGPDGKIAADPAEPDLVGIDVATLRDPHGKPYALMIAKRATEDEVMIDHEAKNPLTNRVEDKSTLAVKSGTFVFACGYYLPPVAGGGKAAAPESRHAAADGWVGRWTTKDEGDAPFTITLDPSGTAESGRGEGQRGFWIVDQDHIRIDWTDGWTDYLVPSKNGHERISFAPGAPRDEKPSSTTALTREK